MKKIIIKTLYSVKKIKDLNQKLGIMTWFDNERNGYYVKQYKITQFIYRNINTQYDII